MPFIQTSLPGVLIFEPSVYPDSRGYFYEAFNAKLFAEAGISNLFVQDNESRSSHGVIRGLHYQRHPHAQAKLVRVMQGRIRDVAVDIRHGSPTFGQKVAVDLSDENKRQLFIPAGFAHGFSVLSETAVVLYKCDAFYSRESEGGICFSDPDLAIDWGISPGMEKVSEKDLILPSLKECAHDFSYEG